MADVFVSYQRSDRLLAEHLSNHLEGRSRSVFLDRKRLEPGTKWEPRIMAELQAAQCVVVLWSRASVKSSWVRKEATSGYMRKRLVQALLDPVDLPEPFASIQAVDLTDWGGVSSPGLEMLLGAVDGVIRLPAGAPSSVAKELDDLVQRLDASTPEKELGSNLLLATWNIRGMSSVNNRWTARPGDRTMRDRRALVAIAEIIRRFDIVVLQEVRALDALNFVRSVLGDDWGVIVLSPSEHITSNYERTAFVFDSRRVMPDGLFDRLGSPETPFPFADKPYATFVDVPYAASFRTRMGNPDSTFTLVLLRLLYGKVLDNPHDLSSLGKWFHDWAEELRSWGQSLLFLGDFGIDRVEDPVYQHFLQSTGMRVPEEMAAAPRTIFETSGRRSFVDHIGWMTDSHGEPMMSLEYKGRAGYVDFSGTIHRRNSTAALAWRLSDHYPIWVELATQASLHTSSRGDRPPSDEGPPADDALERPSRR
jgi:hypothetical protein